MNDYISRQAAIDAADRADYPGLAVEVVKAVTDEVIKELIKLPPTDAIEVVRCKDCKHWDAFDIHSTICPNSRRCKGIIGKMYTAPDYYCAYGERKDG